MKPSRKTPPAHVIEHIDARRAMRTGAEASVSRFQRWTELATARVSRPSAIVAFLAATGAWIVLNVQSEWLKTLDPPPFAGLQLAIAIYVAVLSHMVLVTQARQNREAERRAELDLQVNLVAEQKVAKIVALLEELRRDMPIVKDRADPAAAAMQEALNPSAVLELLERTWETELAKK